MSIFSRKQKKYDLTGINVLPEHVAIIMDGNGRWAQGRGLPRSFGHRSGVETLIRIIRMSSDIGVKVLSLYAFSTENWSRPEDEVSALMELLIEFLKSELAELHANNVKLHILGESKAFPGRVFREIEAGVETTKGNDGMVLNIALNYGSRAEIINAARTAAEAVKEGNLEIGNIDEEYFSSLLYTKGQPMPDLLIRPGGELRLSNFLLWQCAYSELYFLDTLWPDFNEESYVDALRAYAKRKRRFGSI